MSNFTHASEAATTAMESAGSAAQENARFMESWEAATNKLSAAWENLSTAVIGGGANQIVSNLANIVQALSESEVAVVAIRTVLTSGVLWGGSQLLKAMQIIPAITSQFKNLSTVISAIKGGTGVASAFQSLAAGLKATEAGATAAGAALAGGMSASLPIILAVVGGITALVAIIKGIKEATSYETLSANAQKASDATDALVEKYKALQDEYDNLIAKNDKLSIYEQKRLDYLKEELDIENNGKKVEEEIASSREKAFDLSEKAWKKRQKQLTEEVFLQRESYDDEGSLIIENVNTYQEAVNKLFNEFNTGHKSLEDLKQEAMALDKAMQSNVETVQSAKDAQYELSKESESILKANKNLQFLLLTLSQQEEVATESTKAYSDETRKAFENVTDFADAIAEASKMGDGDYDAMFKGYTDAYATLSSEFEAGRIGSVALENSLAQLVDTETYASFASADYADKMQILQNIMPQLATMFGDANSAGLGYLTVMQQLADANGNVVDATGQLVGNIQNIDGQIVYSIENFSGLADVLGVSQGALFSMLSAGKVLGAEFAFNAEDIVANFKEIGLAIEETADGIYSIDFQELSSGLSEIGYSAEEIEAVKQVLSDIDGIELTNVQSEVDQTGEEAEKAKKYIDDVNISLGKIDDITYEKVGASISSLTGLVEGLGTAASTAKENLAGLTVGEVGTNATGTNNFKGGLSLVNDGAKVNGSAKELIVQDGRAFMMQGEPALVNLKKGATIYNASDTQKIIGGIPAFRAGFDPGLGVPPPSVPPPSIGGSGQVDSDIFDDNSGDIDSTTPSVAPSQNVKEIFDAWLKEKKHALAMDEITEQEYYDALEEMNEKYFANSEEYRDEYWKYQEEIYKYRKSQLEDENDLLQKQIELEEALNDMAKAKAGRKYIFSGGQFGYGQDYDAVASAQQRLRELGYSSSMSGMGVISGGIGSTNQSMPYANSGIGSVSTGVGNNIFNIGEIKLDNVADVDSFVSGLKNLALQYAGART